MVNLFKAMAGLMKKFKRKYRLSTEMHDRWGDTAISYPNEGSWNQWNQPSGFVANASANIEPPRHAEPDQPRHHAPIASVPPQEGWKEFNYQHVHTPELQHDTSNIPKGYFDENIRRRPDRGSVSKPQMRGLGIESTRHEVQPNRDLDMHMDDDCSSDSCDEDEERDTLGDARGLIHRGYTTGDIPRYTAKDDYTYGDRPAPSPSLSVTSRMRRASTQSSATQASSIAGTSSRRTSYTAASSVSTPSLPPNTPRHVHPPTHSAHSTHPEKRHAPRPRPREPEQTARQQMVPSYDELYG